MSSFQPNWASKPGNTILDILKERNISTESFVEQMGQSADCVNRLIYGELIITSSLAFKLTQVLGASEQFWLNRQQYYLESLSYVKSLNEDRWLRSLPFEEMVKLGWLKDSGNKLKSCLNFFGVGSTEEWTKLYNLRLAETVNLRTSLTFKSSYFSLACWLRQGEIIGNSMECKPWRPDIFKSALIQIKKLTREKNPKRFIPKLIEICAASGVAVAIVRSPKECKASGATWFLSSDKALLMLSFRYLSDDQFWFTFFHEAGHLLLHEGKGAFLEGLEIGLNPSEMNLNLQEQEAEANDFAGETLIPSQFHSRLSKLKGNKYDIPSFAMEVGVSSGIVVGQMQHYGYTRRNYLNGFKRHYRLEDTVSLQNIVDPA